MLDFSLESQKKEDKLSPWRGSRRYVLAGGNDAWTSRSHPSELRISNRRCILMQQPLEGRSAPRKRLRSNRLGHVYAVVRLRAPGPVWTKHNDIARGWEYICQRQSDVHMDHHDWGLILSDFSGNHRGG